HRDTWLRPPPISGAALLPWGRHAVRVGTAPDLCFSPDSPAGRLHRLDRHHLVGPGAHGGGYYARRSAPSARRAGSNAYGEPRRPVMTAPGPEVTHAASFDYTLWTELLSAIVTPEGKVDYKVLAHHRALLSNFVAQLGTASPDMRPERFPTPEHALA